MSLRGFLKCFLDAKPAIGPCVTREIGEIFDASREMIFAIHRSVNFSLAELFKKSSDATVATIEVTGKIIQSQQLVVSAELKSLNQIFQTSFREADRLALYGIEGNQILSKEFFADFQQMLDQWRCEYDRILTFYGIEGNQILFRKFLTDFEFLANFLRTLLDRYGQLVGSMMPDASAGRAGLSNTEARPNRLLPQPA